MTFSITKHNIRFFAQALHPIGSFKDFGSELTCELAKYYSIRPIKNNFLKMFEKVIEKDPSIRIPIARELIEYYDMEDYIEYCCEYIKVDHYVEDSDSVGGDSCGEDVSENASDDDSMCSDCGTVGEEACGYTEFMKLLIFMFPDLYDFDNKNSSEADSEFFKEINLI